MLRTSMRSLSRFFFDKIQLKVRPRAIILIYHRVANLSTDPQLLSVGASHFQEQIEHIANKYHTISLDELLRIKKINEIPKGTIVITFDDGYGDNLWNAKPVLEHYGVPATVFVTTGYVNSNQEFWWDDLERLILVPERLPSELTLKIKDTSYEWNLAHASQVKKDQQDRNYIQNSTYSYEKSDWNVIMGYYPTPRHKLYCDLHRLLRPLKYEERQTILKKITIWAGLPEMGRPGYRALNREEINSLNGGELIDIGSHTITHSVLKSEPLSVQQKEICDSKRYLEEVLHHEVTKFSYPFGGRGDFSKATIKFVNRAGYHLACANYPDPVTHYTNNYTLPRYLVRNWNGDQFAKKISEWFNE